MDLHMLPHLAIFPLVVMKNMTTMMKKLMIQMIIRTHRVNMERTTRGILSLDSAEEDSLMEDQDLDKELISREKVHRIVRVLMVKVIHFSLINLVTNSQD